MHINTFQDRAEADQEVALLMVTAVHSSYSGTHHPYSSSSSNGGTNWPLLFGYTIALIVITIFIKKYGNRELFRKTRIKKQKRTTK
jgi:hypothetical protein